MSYCRWSSDDFGCDLYCYESDRGYETHVAGNRPVGDIPKVGLFPSVAAPTEKWKEFAERHSAQMGWLSTAEREPIGLPHDGESFVDADLESFLERLESLRAVGYRFPDWVLDDVREEIVSPRQQHVPQTESEK